MGDGPHRSLIVDAADHAGILQFVPFGVWGLETSWGENVHTSSAGAMGNFQFTASSKPGPDGQPVYYPMTNTPDEAQFQEQCVAACGYLKYLVNRSGGHWNPALEAYSGGGYGLLSVIAMYKTRQQWLPVSVTSQYLAWVATGTIEPIVQRKALQLSGASGDYSSWSQLVKSTGQHAGYRASNLRYLAARNRGALAHGIRYLPRPGRATVSPGIHLHVPTPHLGVIRAPKTLYVGGSGHVPVGSGGGRLRPAGGWLDAGAYYSAQRTDQGHDFETDLHGYVIAPGAGHCVRILSDKPFPAGFGPDYPVVYISEGKWAGHMYYIGHCDARVKAGEHFTCAQRLAQVNNSLDGVHGWVELGLAPGGYPGAWGASDSIISMFTPTHTC